MAGMSTPELNAILLGCYNLLCFHDIIQYNYNHHTNKNRNVYLFFPIVKTTKAGAAANGASGPGD